MDSAHGGPRVHLVKENSLQVYMGTIERLT